MGISTFQSPPKTSSPGGTNASSIELWRYIFTIGVVVMHFGYYNGFYIAVDFFFMLSGFLIHKSVCSLSGADPMTILFKKVRRLYPEYVLAFVFMLIFNLRTGIFRSVPLENFCTDSFFELFCMQMLHPYSSLVNGIAWYVSALVLCLPLLIYALYQFKRLYLWIVAPYSALLIYAFFASNWGHVDFGVIWLGVMNGGLLRGFGALNLGVLAYWVYQYLSKKQRSAKIDNVLAGIEITIFTFVMVWSWFNRQTIVDFIEIFLLFWGIILAFLEKGFLSKFLGNRVVAYLGKISYSIYLTQLLTLDFVRRLQIASKVLEIVILIIFATVFGMAAHAIAVTAPSHVLARRKM